MTAAPARSLPVFFRRLLDRESHLDSANLSWYEENLDREVLDYWAVDAPGRLRRSWETGEPHRERVTVRQFLSRTGVLDRFARRERTGIEAVQAAVVNPWGFVGFQFGEPLLIDLGYYRPETVTTRVNGEEQRLPAYYAGPVAPGTWRHGRTSFVPAGEDRVATDVNTWRGTFTGKDGVRSFAGLRTLGAQLAILRSSLRHSLRVLRELAAVEDPWDPSWPGPPPAALLAASHLCGPWGVAAHLSSAAASEDEAGTPITAYLTEFADVELSREDIGEGLEATSA